MGGSHIWIKKWNIIGEANYFNWKVT
jgi:hypothetical protein